MPKHHNWNKDFSVGSAIRREKDRKRKMAGGSIRENKVQLATYHEIDKNFYRKHDIGGILIAYYRLKDIAAIFGKSFSTVQRWYYAGLLPEPSIYELYGKKDRVIYSQDPTLRKRPLFTKQQVLVICNVLNGLFEQGIRQYRKSHIYHADMIYVGNDIAKKRLHIKMERA